MPWLLPDASPISSLDIDDCRERLRGGSRSFHAASLLLPARIRTPASALYAFCREADDLIDSSGREAGDALALLRERLDRIYRGCPEDRVADRAFALVTQQYAIPRGLPEALLEGFGWDADARRYETIDDLERYGARVAGSVGVMMCLVMERRDPPTLARAADLGIAMQLTNICRDVGEDARAGRVYLPLTWLREVGIHAGRLIERPSFTPALGAVIRRVLNHADMLYRRSAPAVAALPLSCWPAIHAARVLYAEIGREIERQDCDSISRRAVVSPRRKAVALLRASPALVPRMRFAGAAPSAAAAQFLIDAVPGPFARERRFAPWQRVHERAIWMIDLWERLERRSQVQRTG